MPAPSYVNQGGTLYGVENAEAAVSILNFDSDNQDPKTYGNDRFGGRIRFAHGIDVSQIYAMSGETTTTLDLTGGLAFGVAEVVANEDPFGGLTGGCYLDDLQHSMGEGAFRTFNANLTLIDGIA